MGFDDKKWLEWNSVLSSNLDAAIFSDIIDPQEANDVFFDGIMTANRSQVSTRTTSSVHKRSLPKAN